MEDLKQRLIAVSTYIGSKIPYWNQGFGGNISVKFKDEMLIKSTGKRLQELRSDSDLALVNWKDIQGSPTDNEEDYRELLKKNRDPAFGVPSMETGIHSASTCAWVFHFHSLPAVLAGEENHDEVKAMFKRHGLAVAFLPKTLPGLSLQIMFSTVHADVVFIAAHGVVLQAENEKIIPVYENAERELCQHFGWNFSPGECASPLKFYFPDTAVYWEEFQKYLRPVNDTLFVLAEEAPSHLREIWIAQALLYRNNPELGSFTDAEAAQIANLPTEQMRKKGH